MALQRYRSSQTDPALQDRLRAKADKLAKKIAFNRRNPGDTPEEQAETEKLIKQLGGERAEVLADLAIYEAHKERPIAPPTPETVQQMLDELGQILTSAAEAKTEEEMRIARRIIDELTGGRIDLFQMGPRKAQQGWLQGRFKVRLLPYLVERMTGLQPESTEEGVEVVIDYRDPPPYEALSEEAKHLYDQGLMMAQIAKELGCGRSRVTKLIKFWFESRGQAMPDGRSRRKTLKQKSMALPNHQQIADEAKALFNEGLLLGGIAKRLDCDCNTITAAIRYWHESRGLPVPDGRTRRKSLEKKTSRKRGQADPDPAGPQDGEAAA